MEAPSNGFPTDRASLLTSSLTIHRRSTSSFSSILSLSSSRLLPSPCPSSDSPVSRGHSLEIDLSPAESSNRIVSDIASSTFSPTTRRSTVTEKSKERQFELIAKLTFYQTELMKWNAEIKRLRLKDQKNSFVEKSPSGKSEGLWDLDIMDAKFFSKKDLIQHYEKNDRLAQSVLGKVKVALRDVQYMNRTGLGEVAVNSITLYVQNFLFPYAKSMVDFLQWPSVFPEDYEDQAKKGAEIEELRKQVEIHELEIIKFRNARVL